VAEVIKPIRAVKAVYSAEDRDVMAPVAVQQRVPKYPANVTRPLQGVLQFVVDETGAVQSPTMPVSIDMSYDAMVLSAAKKWQYQPATLDGKPVKYVKKLTISVSSAPAQ
jgi:Gram-negative bacterial TonB protein C-terminal